MIKKTERISVNVSLLPENYLFIYDYIIAEETRGLKINFSRAINALISQVKHGKVKQNEVNFKKRKRPLPNLLTKRIESIEIAEDPDETIESYVKKLEAAQAAALAKDSNLTDNKE